MMEQTLKQAGEKALNMAVKKGVEAEAFLLYDKTLSIELSSGKVETLKEAEQIGMGIRVIDHGKLGFAYSSDLSDTAIEKLVENAVRISAYTALDLCNRLPEAQASYPDLATFDPQVGNASLESKITMASEVEKIARAVDPRIQLVERAGYEDTDFCNLIMNTNGLYAYDRGSFCGLYLFLVAQEDSDAQNGFSTMVRKKFAELNPHFVGEEAARRAIRSLGARTIPSGKMPCIMESQVVVRFLSLIAQSVEADSVLKGKSMFAGKVGQSIASDQVTIIDDALHADGVASFPFDGEGVATQRNPVISEGILEGFLYDTYCACKEGKHSTGNGQRGSFRSLPSVGSNNFILSPGEATPEQLISGVSRGLYITDVMGMHTANPISGDFSVGASGIMIEKGALSYPVRGITIAGNVLQLLKDIEAVGNDLRFFGSKAAPSVLLRTLSIGGE